MLVRCAEEKWRGGPTHASIYSARSVRVYSDAVFPEIGSLKRPSSTNPRTTERKAPRNDLPAEWVKPRTANLDAL